MPLRAAIYRRCPARLLDGGRRDAITRRDLTVDLRSDTVERP